MATADAAALAIDVSHLTKRYGSVQAVDDISFQVKPGELVGFLGPNGAGKSTTMRILTTMQPASSGSAKIFGLDVMEHSLDIRKKLGYLPESVPVYTEMRVEEYLHYRARLKGIDRRERTRRVEEALLRCRIREVRRRLLGTLSKGYRQRVGLADTVVQDAPLLIMDEPTSGLDPVQIRETLNLIRDLAGTHTVMLSTHILSEVEAICDRVIIINRGKLRWDGKLSALRSAHPSWELDIAGPQEDVERLLRNVPGILTVDSQQPNGQDIPTYLIETQQAIEVDKTLVQPIVQAGFGLRRLNQKRVGLEELYMNVVLRNDVPTP